MADGKTLRVLLCDDEPGMRLILRKLVERAEGFEIVGEAEDGEEGLRLFEEKRPDVVFLDVDMPRLNGVETAKRIQDMDPRAALIFATAYEGYRDEAFEVYAFDYLVKPFKNERVLATLERIRGLLAGSDRTEPPRDLKPRPAARKRRDRLLLRSRDGVVFLDMDPEVADRLIAARAEETAQKRDIHERDRAYLHRCHAAYEELAAKYGWTRVACSENGEPRSVAAIHADVYAAVLPLLEGVPKGQEGQNGKEAKSQKGFEKGTI